MMDKIGTEAKIIGTIVIFTIIVLVGGVFLLSSQQSQDTSIPEEQIVSSNGLHWHPTLEIYIKGDKQEIPPNTGIGTVHQPIHTHEDAAQGVIHMEMSGTVTKDETRIGNFFKVWGKEFSSNQIFDSVNGEEGKVRMMVNGVESDQFENYEMKDGDKIEIRYE